jgi:hypothetical protein
MGISDGFRPTNSHSRPIQMMRRSLDSSLSRHSSTATRLSDLQPLEARTRNSIAKGPRPNEKRNGGNDPFRDPPSRSTSNPRHSLSHRTSAVSTSSFVTTAQSDMTAGPSHPYGMYPQGTGVARTPSVTTTSTGFHPTRTQSLQRPTHPYGMYPQNPVEDEDERPQHPQRAIPVGFPGLNAGYHRQIGPDGEEQDIVGPDGHTEQLPPYSRFPEEGHAKRAPVPASTSAQTAAPTLMSPTQSTISQREAFSSSPDTPTSDTVNLTQNSQTSHTPSSEQSRTGEKPWSEKSWRERRKTKVLFGAIPCWLLALLLLVLVIFGAIIGVAVGTMRNKQHEKGKNHKGKGDPQ